jgi:hypothetical protein
MLGSARKKRYRNAPSIPLHKSRGRDGDEQAAYAVAVWLQRADLNGSLGSYFNPPLTPEEREVAAVEGWILGVV